MKTSSSFCADHQTVFKLTWSWTVRASPDWGLTFKFFAHVGFFPVNLSLESEQRPSWRHLSEDAGIRDCNQLLRLCAMLCATTCQSSTYQVFSGDHIKTVSSNFCQPLPFFRFFANTTTMTICRWPSLKNPFLFVNWPNQRLWRNFKIIKSPTLQGKL